MKTYNKLVRDKIPEIIENAGKTAVTRILNKEEYRTALKNKLVEESVELLQANTSEEIIEELGDLYEVLEAFLSSMHIDKHEIDNIRIKKNVERGAFENRLFLEFVE